MAILGPLKLDFTFHEILIMARICRVLETHKISLQAPRNMHEHNENVAQRLFMVKRKLISRTEHFCCVCSQ
jgi:hypothetical protein